MTPCSHDNKELNFSETKGSTFSQAALQEEMDTLDILTISGLECVASCVALVLWRKWDIFRAHGSPACRFGAMYSPKELGPLTQGSGGLAHLLSNTDCRNNCPSSTESLTTNASEMLLWESAFLFL